MMGGRVVAMFLAAAIFFLQGGDCLSMFVKDKQAQDCCKKGHCSRTNPVKQKTALPELAAMPVAAVWVQPVSETLVEWARHRTTFAPSPPGERGNFSLPLLV
jgi:hypothetical protein